MITARLGRWGGLGRSQVGAERCRFPPGEQASTLGLIIPLEAEVTALVERAGVAVPRPGRFAALVVVNSPVVRETVAHTLRAMGARHVLEIGSVAEARARAGAGIADIVVAEAGLPDGSGIA